MSEACKKNIKEAEVNLDEIDKFKNVSENYIYEYFEDIKRQVDLRRETLKVEIDDYSDDIINKVNQTRQKCYTLSEKSKLISAEIEKSRIKLNQLSIDFDTFVIEDKKLEDISLKVNDLKPKLVELLEEYKYSLLDNKKYEFNFDPIEIEDIFGRFSIQNGFLTSKILTEKNRLDLTRICEFPREQKWALIYSGSRDGFGSKDFHNKCDGVKNTLTIMKAKNNFIFGGYTNEPWSSNPGFVYDQDAFLFSIVNNTNAPFKAICSRPYCAIYCDPNYGPIFGYGDLGIVNNCNTTNNYCHFGTSYKYKNYGTQELSGDQRFKLTEIEIYKKL